jgi:hypothetical protein
MEFSFYDEDMHEMNSIDVRDIVRIIPCDGVIHIENMDGLIFTTKELHY